MTQSKRAHSGHRIWDIEVGTAASDRLSRVRRKDTAPELRVRHIVHSLGHRYRLDNAALPGRPDLANRARRWAIFVHGCFWHHHEGCSRATIPKNNRDFWLEKFDANRNRDRRAVAELEHAGFQVVVIWECETEDESLLEARLAETLSDKLP